MALIAGYVSHVTLARVLGAAEYGDYGIVLNALSTVSLLITAGLPEAIASQAAENPEAALGIARRGMRLQARLSLLLGVAYAVASPFLADLLRDRPLAPYLAVSAISIPAVALLAVAQGTFNGLRRHGAQGMLIGGSALARMVAVVGLGLVLRLKGAVTGLVIAPILTAAIVIPMLRPWDRRGANDAGKLSRFARPVVVFTISLALLMNLDLFGVKILGLPAERLGHYTAAATIAKMPYFGLSSLGVVLLPALSAATAGEQKAQALLGPAFRWLLLASLLITATLIPLTGAILRFLYGDEYVWASLPLALLFCSGTFLTLYFVLSYSLYGAGQPRTPTALTLVGLVIELAALALLMRPFGATGAAVASCATSSILFVALLASAKSSIGPIVSAKTISRAGIAFLGTAGTGIVLLDDSRMALLFAPLLAFSNVALLVVTRETSLHEIKSLLRGSRSAEGARAMRDDGTGPPSGQSAR